MADNVPISAGVGTAIAADDIGSVFYQRVKATWGPDGTANDTDVASGKPLPVQLRGSAGADVVKLEDAASGTGDPGIVALVRRTATPANTSDTDGDLEYLQVSLGHLWVAAPPLVKVSANFTAAANGTTYIANEWISDNGTAGSVTKLSWAIPRANGTIRRVRIKKSDQTVATPTIRLWLWDTTFTVAVGDNATGAQPLTDSIDLVDVACTNAGSDDAVGWSNCDIPFAAATLYGLIQSQSTFTGGTSEVWTVDLWYLPG